MAKTKKILSLLTSLAMAASAFSAFVFPAYAAEEVLTAELVHTAAAQGGSNAALTTLDVEEHYLNNWGTTGWAGEAYTEFAVNELTADSASRITNATLKFQTKSSRGTRPMQVTLLDKATADAIDFTQQIDMMAKTGTEVASYTDIGPSYAEKTVDVTQAVKALAEEGSSKFIFAYGGATAGGYIYGKAAAAENQPSLTLTLADASAVSRDITINYVDENGEVIKTESDTAMSGTEYTVDAGKCVDFTDTVNGTKYLFSYNEASSTTSIPAVSATEDNIITLSFNKTAYASVTVNNVVDTVVLKAYTDEALVGSTYELTNAQKGYKLNDGKYYFMDSSADTSAEVPAEGLVMNVPFVENTDESLILYEDFANLEDTWGFEAGHSSVALKDGYIALTQYNATSGDLNNYGFYYSDVKSFDDSVKNSKTAQITMEWESTVEKTKNRKNAFGIYDSQNRVIFEIASQAGKGSTDSLEAGITYAVGDHGANGTNIPDTGWTDSNSSGIYTIALNLDFTGEKAKVTGSITGGKASVNIEIPETEVDADCLAKLVASDIYSLAPQNLHSVKINGETQPVIPSESPSVPPIESPSVPPVESPSTSPIVPVESPSVPPVESPSPTPTASPIVISKTGAVFEVAASDKDRDATLIEVNYNDDETMAYAQTTKLTIAAGQTKVYTEGKKGSTLMLWDTLTSMTPLASKAISDSYEIIVTPKPEVNAIYKQDYEDATAADWVSANAQDMVTLVEEDGNKYVSYDISTGRPNDRGANLIFDGDAKLAAGADYAIEFDLAVSSGDDHGTEFAVLGSDYAYGSKNMNNGVESGAVISIIAPAKSATWTINKGNTVDLTAGSFYHYIVAVKGTTAYLTITDSTGAAVLDKALYPIDGNGGLAGLYFKAGRYTAAMKIDNILVRELYNGEIPDVKYYTAKINTTRFAVMTTTDGTVYYADADGKIELPLLTSGTKINYALTKTGYSEKTGSIEITDADVEVNEALDLVDDTNIFLESDFGNADGVWLNESGSRGGSINLGTVAIPDVSNVSVDISCGALGSDGNSQRTWAIVTDGGTVAGLQWTSGGLVAWTGWTGSAGYNGSGDGGAYANGIKLADFKAGEKYTVNFVIDKAGKVITVSCGDISAALPYTINVNNITGMTTGMYRSNAELKVEEIRVTEPDPTYMSLNGDVDFAKVSGKTVSRQYNRTETVIDPNETFNWTITPPENGSTDGISLVDGVLSVEDTAMPGVYTISATGTINKEKTASLNVTIHDFAEFTSENISWRGATVAQLSQGTVKYEVLSIIDSYQDDVTDMFAPVWTSSNTDVATIDSETGVATLKSNGETTISLKIGNAGKEATLTQKLTVAEHVVSVNATGNSTEVSLAGLVKDSHITGYLVTTANDKGELVKQETVAYSDTITVDTTGAVNVEVSPVFEYTGSDISTIASGVQVDLPSNTYNITFTQAGSRSDFYVNDQLIANNVNQGSDKWSIGRVSKSDTVYTAEDIVVTEPYVTFSLRDNAGASIKKVEVKKAPANVKRAQRIYVIGDSLVARYYGDDNPAEEAPYVRTGWGQVLDKFIVDSVKVTNLGNSGAWAEGMLQDAFTNVMASAKAGDIMILESGYNDRNHQGGVIDEGATETRMQIAIRKMVEGAKSIGVVPIVVTPNASAHDYTANVVSSNDVRTIASNSGALLIDLAADSYAKLSELYGASLNDSTTALMLKYYNNVNDTLHSSYNAANMWAAIIAQGLYDNGYDSIVNTEYSYTFNDGIQDVTAQVTVG